MGKASAALPDNHPFYAPGLHRRPRAHGQVSYWLPPGKDVRDGYRPKSITLPDGLTEEEIAAQCQRLWRDLLAWRLRRPAGPTRYSVAWLIRRYLSDDTSPYQRLGHRASRTYLQFCKMIEADIGERRIDPDGTRPRILGEHIRIWHSKWGEPADGKTEPRPGRARHLLVQFRLLISYAVELGVPGTSNLSAMLSKMRFSQIEPRNVAPTREQVMALVDKAIEMGRPSIAGVSLGQFEFMERRAHIIGSYVSGQWRPGWTWGDISSDWKIKYYATKVGKIERAFDLKAIPKLLAILQAVPKDKRIGAVFKDEKSGDPWRERHYAEVFRTIADAAGWPVEIKSMDLRAGAATEADAIEGITDRHLQDAGGWLDPKTKDRYRRNKQRNAQNVVTMRQKAREASS